VAFMMLISEKKGLWRLQWELFSCLVLILPYHVITSYHTVLNNVSLNGEIYPIREIRIEGGGKEIEMIERRKNVEKEGANVDLGGNESQREPLLSLSWLKWWALSIHTTSERSTRTVQTCRRCNHV
jgi:hypothetical protein